VSAVLAEGCFGEFCEDVVDPRQTGEPSGYLAIHELAVIGPLVASAVAPTSGMACSGGRGAKCDEIRGSRGRAGSRSPWARCVLES
jgi:hypothetical protein